MNRDKTYTLSLACADVVRKTSNISGRAHKDGRLDLVERAGGDGRGGGVDVGAGIRPTADGVVHDLTTLGVANQDDLSIGAAGVEVVHSRGDGVGALTSRLAILYTAAAGLTAASRILDRLAGGTGEGLQNEVDNLTGGAEAGSDSGLTGTEDVDLGALALGENSPLGFLNVNRGTTDDQGVGEQEEKGVLW